MNSYISLAYLILFLPAVVLLYAVMPKKAKPYVLLAASVAFAYLISHFFIIYLVVTALSVYVAALLVKKQKERCKTARTVAENREEKKIIKARYTRIQLFIVSLAIILNIGILSVLKYSPFFLTTFNQVFAMFNIGIKLPLPKFHACIGISFYTLQAVSYIHDVYKDKVEADTNFARLALYMSFFPIIMEGPICRYADTALPLWEGKKIEYKNFTYGLQRIAYGIMKKVVVADRTNLLVTTIFREFQYCNYDGGIILLGAVMYTIELYKKVTDGSGTRYVKLNDISHYMTDDNMSDTKVTLVPDRTDTSKYVYTGEIDHDNPLDNEKMFEATFSCNVLTGDATHNEYANYKIQLTAQLIGPSNSWKDAYLIYTNAKINPAVIDEP